MWVAGRTPTGYLSCCCWSRLLVFRDGCRKNLTGICIWHFPLASLRNTEAYEARWTPTFFRVFFTSRLKFRNKNFDGFEGSVLRDCVQSWCRTLENGIDYYQNKRQICNDVPALSPSFSAVASSGTCMILEVKWRCVLRLCGPERCVSAFLKLFSSGDHFH